MSAQGAFKITEEFERLLCEYTGAPYAVAVDNCSNALFLALTRADVRGKRVIIPRHTYPSVPCAIIHAGGLVQWGERGAFVAEDDVLLRGAYPLGRTGVWDCALRFTAGMYRGGGQTQCLSFTGPYKHLKLGKGGAILTDSREDYEWYKRARFSGRNECSYLVDSFDMLGWNFYMLPEIAARGVALMAGFLRDGNPVVNADLSFRFPDLSRFPIYTNPRGEADGPVGGLAPDVLYGFRCDGGLRPVHPLHGFRDHIGAQSATVTREDAENEATRAQVAEYIARRDAIYTGEPVAAHRACTPMRCVVPPPTEPCQGYDAYRGTAT